MKDKTRAFNVIWRILIQSSLVWMVMRIHFMLLFLMDTEVPILFNVLQLGKETAIYVSQHLHENLIAAIKLDDLKTTQHRLEYAYYKTDMESKIKDVKMSGSTAVTILIVNENGKRVLYSANAGDARSIFYSDGTTQRLSFVVAFLCVYLVGS